jgi:galactonate dehydratase
MRIAEVRSLVLGTPWRNLTFVVVRTDEGLEGVGETRMVNHTEALLGYLEEAVPRHVLGTDPFAIESLVQRMRRDDYARAGEIAMSALAVIEMACWDIVGKALDQPVYRLLGGPVRTQISAYANGWYGVERTAEEFHAAARRVIERGYRALKLDPFGAGWYELSSRELRLSLSLVEAVRDAIGPDAELFIEMHGRFTPRQAITIARELERVAPGWIEEPVPPENVKALAKVAQAVDIPVATGERIHVRHEFREVLELQAADIIQPDVAHCGGLLETKKIAAWAESYYVLVAPHNVGGPVATSAALHLAAATPNFKIQEHFNDFVDPHVREAAHGVPEVVDGAFALPSAPGLGVTLNEDAIREHPPTRTGFNLFSEGWHARGAPPAPRARA